MLRWKIDLPIITRQYLEALKMLVLFEFIPTGSIILWIKEKFGFDEETVTQEG